MWWVYLSGQRFTNICKEVVKANSYVIFVTDRYSTSYKRVRIRGLILSFVDYCV